MSGATVRDQLPTFYTSAEGGVFYNDPAILALKPAPNRIIVQIDSFAYKGKIIVPDKAKRSPTTGKVIAIGSAIREHSWIKVGMTLVYGMYSGTALKFKDVPVLRVLTEDEVLCEKGGSAEIESDVPQE